MVNALPQFPELAELRLEHRPILDPLLRAVQPRVSELTFTNLYIWRRAYGARVTRRGEVVCLFSLRENPQESFLLPPLGASAGGEDVRLGLKLMADLGHAPRLARIDRRESKRLGLSEAEFEFTPDRDNWDYVYRVRDLIDLPEDRYGDKRRNLRQFEKLHYEYRRITPDLVPACQALQDLWCDEKHCDLYSTLRAEAGAVKEVLGQLEPLGVTGGCLLVNGRVQAFTLGEPLNENTVVIHIEKATPELRGAFQAINREFLAREWAEWEYVNREQDMGEPGLRQAKGSYHPDHLVEKFVVTRKGDI